ncbi:MAG: aminotransferase class V-fold PLP-dependent enzyme [Planctomycetes bacterium]|nr:aminotransferase class V-fold PLP-dependent enzyme [Planctomycetota bacterium]
MIYLDYNATTPVDPAVFEAMRPMFLEAFGNPSSGHTAGRRAAAEVSRARERVAAAIGATAHDIVFTSGGTEADNLAVRGLAAMRPERRHLVCSAVEHPAVLVTCRSLAAAGYRLTEIPVNRQGRLDLEALQAALTPDTALCALMAANNETGSVLPVAEAGRMCRERGVPFHVDATQALGKIPVNVGAWNCDTLACSAHKLYGPKGTGALFVRRGLSLVPQQLGGHQERELRGGTHNAAGIVGFGVACEIAVSRLAGETARLRDLRDRLERGVLAAVPGAVVNGLDPSLPPDGGPSPGSAARLPNTTNISFPGVDAQALLITLDQAGICASGGAACASGAIEASSVLLAMGVPEEIARGAIRFSVGRMTTEGEMARAVQVVSEVCVRLHASSR